MASRPPTKQYWMSHNKQTNKNLRCGNKDEPLSLQFDLWSATHVANTGATWLDVLSSMEARVHLALCVPAGRFDLAALLELPHLLL